MNTTEDINKFFAYGHLPEYLQEVSKQFYSTALFIITNLSASAERTLSLRSLWEAKNYVVWCAVQDAAK